ncbi:histidine kinase dimerization/phosphoacceptor domain -containing protein [Thalassococcus sp. BH17M4-6]|uniref:histidine kinase dimerization/phosphoacceptor domain -containing protein n=1 Tax=Thalassococcus sp. BH17M4-6 TaxID=3413148 RepID=UPI003BEBF19B
MLAPPPPDQKDRLAELGSLEVLDTAAEPSFDSVVELAARICDCPIALISLVDKDRQWFKARFGFDAPQTPLNQSVCSHAILGAGMLEIPDLLEDPRTADNPLCIEVDNPVRFYAGAPLVSARGHAMGTLCVLDHVPRQLTDLQRQTLMVLADQVMRQLELQRTLRNESVLRDEIDHRVKNSLQTVMSFIRLYRSRAKLDETRDALDAIGRRVSAIAQLHSELYQTNEFDRIPLDRYLGRVATLLQGNAGANVTVRTDIAPIHTDSRVAATLAMIVSEFSANAMKHAFPDGRTGEVFVGLEGITPDGLCLTCRDNGIGSADPGTESAPEVVSIGKRLMESAAEQIGAEMSLEATADGYCLKVVRRPSPQPQPELQADAP